MDGAALDKFRKICGLLGSDHDGERANAARLATALLKQNGASWNAISIGTSNGRADDVRSLQHQIGYWQMMLGDERARTTHMSQEIGQLKRALKTMELKLNERETGVPVAEQRKREKAEKKAKRDERRAELERKRAAKEAASTRTNYDTDAPLREHIREALEQTLPERTREFLESVSMQKAWTHKQREAIDKTLRWVFRS